MNGGRPHNSTTPARRSKSAIQVRAYRFLIGNSGTKADCARQTGLSRTTVIKWWDTVAWSEEASKNFDSVQNWLCDSCCWRNTSARRCADELGLPYDVVEYEMQTSMEISRMMRYDNQEAGLFRDV